MNTAAMDRVVRRYIRDHAQRVDAEQHYRAWLDSMYDFSMVGGPFKGMISSAVLKKMDNAKYASEFKNYLDEVATGTEEIAVLESNYYLRDNIDEVLEELNSDLLGEYDELDADATELYEAGNKEQANAKWALAEAKKAEAEYVAKFSV